MVVFIESNLRRRRLVLKVHVAGGYGMPNAASAVLSPSSSAAGSEGGMWGGVI
jgi:hypothetical protein